MNVVSPSNAPGGIASRTSPTSSPMTAPLASTTPAGSQGAAPPAPLRPPTPAPVPPLPPPAPAVTPPIPPAPALAPPDPPPALPPTPAAPPAPAVAPPMPVPPAIPPAPPPTALPPAPESRPGACAPSPHAPPTVATSTLAVIKRRIAARFIRPLLRARVTRAFLPIAYRLPLVLLCRLSWRLTGAFHLLTASTRRGSCPWSSHCCRCRNRRRMPWRGR